MRHEVHRSVLLTTRTPFPLLGLSGIPRRISARARDADLLHAHFLYSPGAAAVEAARGTRIPCVVTAHGFDVYDLPRRSRAWRRTVLATLRGASAVVTVSRKNADLLRDLGFEGTCAVIPNGYDPRIFRPGPAADARHHLGLPAAGRLVVAVGHLSRVKGFDVLLEALPRVPGAHLVLVGGGPEHPALRARARSLQVAGRVTFAGEVPHVRVADFLRAADLVAISSRAEGNPTVLVEALACGRPVVATAVGGIPEMWREEGALVPPEDPRRLAEAIRGALDRTWDAPRLAASAAAWSWARLAEDLLRVYRQAAGGTA